MSKLTLGAINDITLDALRPPGLIYYLSLGGLAGLFGIALMAFLYQTLTGMGVAGIHQPVDWGVYIANFVFWVGIAHSGTLISAILHLVRAEWRDAVSRASEAMTVFAVMTAGMFPMFHLGRVWLFYYLMPYPSQRQLWPNFLSPLVWDVLAVSTYLTVSLVFFLVGLAPDAAAARDRAERKLGERHILTRLYRTLSLGWCGAGSQWRHYGRSYLFFAALATPLVISVHSIVSWDFAMSMEVGWHSTIFPPYFVAGAIHSGLAMVLTLMIPMRRLLKLEKLITHWHFEMVAKTMLVTTGIVAYSYALEPFLAWYTGDIFERQFTLWRTYGWIALVYWALIPLNVLAPLLFVFRKVRCSLKALFAISILVNLGMWLERLMIVTASTSYDFMPHTWSSYFPSWVELAITFGAFGFFFTAFLIFTKVLPTVPMADLKTLSAEPHRTDCDPEPAVLPSVPADQDSPSVLAVYDGPDTLYRAVQTVLEGGHERIETFSPTHPSRLMKLLGMGDSPVRFWTLAGVLFGMGAGFGLAAYASSVNSLVVGGKPPIAVIPFMIPTFEFAILFGTLGNLTGLIIHARLTRLTPMRRYDPRFSHDKYGLLVECAAGGTDPVKALLKTTQPEETHVFA